MNVLAISSFPVEAAATRFRVAQYVNRLTGHDITVSIMPFLETEQFRSIYESDGNFNRINLLLRSILNRIKLVFGLNSFELLLVQREAMIFGPAIFEWLYQKIGRLPMVLDLDDATYVRYVSPTYGRLGTALKFFGKTDRLIDRSSLVICGNRFIADYVEKRGTPTVVIPTIVDTEVFKPISKENEIPVIGWIGTHSTFPFLERLLPVLEDLAKKHKFKLKVVGSNRKDLDVDGLEVETFDWKLEKEVSDFQSLDIGLYPLDMVGKLDPAWLAGKSGFKAIQYLAVGIPFVMSPIGVCAEIGVPGKTHFNAESPEDWYNCLDKLLSNRELGRQMGMAGREYSEKHYRLDQHADMLANVLKTVAAGGRTKRAR